MDEEIKVQPEEIVEEQLKAGFLENLKLHKFKILGGILGVLVFIGAVFGAYKLGQRQVYPEPVEGPTPTPLPSEAPAKEGDPTANWKTYTNTKYKFSFKYPSELNHQRSESELNSYNQTYGLEYRMTKIFSFYTEELDKTILSPDGNPIKFKPWDLTGIFIKDYEGKTPEEIKKTLETEYYNFLNRNLKIIKIDNLLDVVRYTHCEQSCGEIALIPINNQFLQIELYTVKDIGIGDPENIFNLILSTFKFTSEEAVKEKVFCKEPRPQVCTMECIQNPPYICGSDGNSYCSTCQACAESKVKWYVIQDTPCGTE